MPLPIDEEVSLPVEEVADLPPAVTRDSDYQDNVVDTKVHPITELVTHIDGMSWTVDYYGQILGSGQTQQGQDLIGADVLQQYTLTKDLEFKVTAPLSSSLDETTQQFTVTGTAYIYAGVIPNVSDMFIANAGDGKLGVLELTSVARITHLEGSAFEVSYVMVDYASPERMSDFTAKTVQTFFFERDRLSNATRGILSTNDNLLLSQVQEGIQRLTMDYLNEFYSEDQSTLVLGDIYDPHVVAFVRSIIPVLPSAFKITNLAMSYEKYTYHTLYDWILNGDVNPLTLRTTMREVGVGEFTKIAVYGGIAHSGLATVVFPYDESPTYGTVTIPMPINTDLIITPAPTVPDIVPVNIDSTYVLTRGFYADEPCVSVLEQELRSFLSGDAVVGATILRMTNAARTWTTEERFYYVPLLLCLLHVLDKEF